MADIPVRTIVVIAEELGRVTAEIENRLNARVGDLGDRLISAEATIADLTRRLEASERRDLRQALNPPARLRSVA